MDFRSLYESRRVKDGQWQKTPGIKGYQFVVKYYQRGYRWTKDNIRKLLFDIDKYINEDASKFYEILDYIKSSSSKNDKTEKFDFYCLQALSVKELSEKQYELIDGQQRLTSMFVLFELLDSFLNSSDERSESPYDIIYDRGNGNVFNLSEYVTKKIPITFDGISPKKAYKMEQSSETRTQWFRDYKDQLKDSLINASDDDISTAGNSLSIDLYYMAEVATEVIDFIMNYKDDDGDSANLKKFYDFIKWNTLFIWYEIPCNIKAEDEFIGLNSNKIQLTNAELIKALVLKKDEQGKTPENGGNRWETIEQGLFQGDLWAFISGEKKATRIDLILELFARQNGYCPPSNDDNDNSLFDWYEEYSKQFSQSVFANDIIQGVENIYNRICEWYDDVEIYHYVGLLTQYRQLKLTDCIEKNLTQEGLIKLIFDKFNSSNSKQDFIVELKRVIKQCILKGARDTKLSEVIDESTFSYDEPSQQANIKAILWAMNVWETVNAAENNESGSGRRKQTVVRRLPFSQVNGPLKNHDTWTLEHIMPQNPADEASQTDKDIYERFRKEAKKDGAGVIEETDIHEIGNMALLRKGDNSSIHNANLQEKRKELTQRAIGEGNYVPGSTINAFGLYYNMLLDDYHFSALDDKYWTKTDRDNYLLRIKACLEDYNV